MSEMFLSWEYAIFLSKFTYKLCLLSNGMVQVDLIFILKVYQICYEGVYLWMGHLV